MSTSKKLTPRQISEGMQQGKTYIWEDPDYIEGNDYDIVSIDYPVHLKDNKDAIILIEYNGYNSSAAVPVFEIHEKIIE